MKFSIVFFTLINGIIGGVINQTNYGSCDDWKPLIKSTGFEVVTDCCNINGFDCQDSKVKSIDITVKTSGAIDLTKLPKSINLDKYSIKGDIYEGEFPVELINSQLYKILDLSDSSIITIPENINENNITEEIYLKNNQIYTMPSQFNNIKSLRVLNLEGNKIEVTNIGFQCSKGHGTYRFHNNNNKNNINCDYTEDPGKHFCKDFPNLESLLLNGNTYPIDISNSIDYNFNCKQRMNEKKSGILWILGISIVFIICGLLLVFIIKQYSSESEELKATVK